MSYDGVVTSGMVQELKTNILMGKIEKIYQPQPEQLLFLIHTKNGKKRLFISASGSHSALYLVDKTPENPVTPPLFCMVLRKHLGAARITEISQHEKDRIIEIYMETVDELGFNVNRKLIIEIMGKHSNVLLVDMQTGKIIESIKHVGIDVNRARQILPGKIYSYPPAQTKIPFDEVSESQIALMVRDQLQPERSLLDGIQGLSPVLAQSIAIASADDIDNSVSYHKAYDRITNLTDIIAEGKFMPSVYLKDGKPADFHIVPLALYETDSRYESRRFSTISEAAQYFFVNRESSNTIRQKSNDLKRIVNTMLNKQTQKLQKLHEDLLRAENSDKYRLFGELLTANLHLVRPGAQEVTVTSYYDGEPVRIPLDPKYSPSRNAQNYYKKYGKAKTAVKEKDIQIKETNSEIEYLNSVISFIEMAETIDEVDLIKAELIEAGYIRNRKPPRDAHGKNRRNKGKPKPYLYKLSSGKQILVGRNNKENDWLTFKKASQQDIWMHTKDIPGSHLILVTGGEEPSEQDLFEAAAAAAYHSKGRASENVPVDYVKVRYVKKPAGSRPGFVIFTHNRTLYINPALPGDKTECKE